MADRIQQRRDTAARWAQFNPILLEGEVGYVTDKPNEYKIGDGINNWNNLPLRGYDGTLSQLLEQSSTSAPSTKLLTDSLSLIYKKNIKLGSNAFLISSAIKKIVINSSRDTTKRYFLTAVRRNNIAEGDTAPTSQIEIYSTDASDVNLNRQSVARWQTNGDPNENKVSKIEFGTTTKCLLFIDWSKIPDGASYTIMFSGYELSDECFDTYAYSSEKDLEILNLDKDKKQTTYPFINGSLDNRIPILKNLIVYLYIKNRDEKLKYYLSSVLRFAIPDGATVAVSQIGIYSKDESNTISPVVNIRIQGDEGADGKLKRYTSKEYDIVVDWSKVEIGTKITDMISSSNIELSNEIFIKRNYDSEIDFLQNSPLFNINFILLEGEYVNKTNGLISTSPIFSRTDFIAVFPGQTVHYEGYLYGNATVCGYKKDKSSFIDLINPPTTTAFIMRNIVIPDDVYFIRATTQKINNVFSLVLNTDVNTEYINNIISSSIDEIELNNTNNNIIQDPFFKYGIMLASDNPKIIGYGGGSSISLSEGIAVVKSTVLIAKGCQIMARFNQGWATQFGLKAGDKIKIGAYIKAKVSEVGVVTSYGTLSRQDIPSTQITYTGPSITLPVGSISEWQWIERVITLKTDGTDIDQTTDLSLGYIQVTDPNANVTPTELYIKQPCIIFNPTENANGFYNSKRSEQIDYLFVNFLNILGNLSVNNLSVNGGQLEINSFISTFQKAKVRWLELSDNQSFPTKGVFIGLKNGTDVIISVNGTETKIN